MLIRAVIFFACCLPILSLAADSDYYSIRADTMRKCPSPVCGGVFVQQVNKPNTRCADKSRKKECYAAEIDWSSLQLTPEQVDTAHSLAVSGHAILRGHLRNKQFGEIGNLGVFVVNEAWETATNTPSNGTFYNVRLNGVRCIAAPCNAMEQTKLNTNAKRNIVGVDLSKVGASELKLNNASEELSKAGILVTGTHKTEKGSAGRSLSLIASQFYLPLTANSKQCHIGGCSGQLCGDTPDNLISTCEFRPEYSCYSTSSCEQQTDGNCGWTASKELTDCLDNARKLPGGIEFR